MDRTQEELQKSIMQSRQSLLGYSLTDSAKKKLTEIQMIETRNKHSLLSISSDQPPEATIDTLINDTQTEPQHIEDAILTDQGR